MKQLLTTSTPKTVLNIYIVYEINIWLFNLESKFALSCLFGAAESTKIGDSDKYSHSGYGIGFDKRRIFSLSDNCGYGKSKKCNNIWNW